MNRLGIETLSAFGLPPVEYVNLAADLGCANISLGLASFLQWNPHGYAPWDLKTDAQLRKDMIAAMRDRGVTITLAEGLLVRPDEQASNRGAEFDVFAELGATRVNVVSMDPDLSRTLDEFAATAEMASARGMVTTTEFAPGLTVCTLPGALEAVRTVNRPDFKLLIDTMHLIRSGSSPADLAAIDPGLIGYVQICDAPLVPEIDNYMIEACTERRVPGTGDLPLLEILKIAPRDCVVSLEAPLLSQAQAGVGPHDRLRPAVEAVKALLAKLDK